MKLQLHLRLFGNRRNALKTLIVSNLFILLIPMAMGLFLYAKVEQSLEKSSNRSNAAMLEQLKLLLDNKLAEVDILTHQVVFDPKLDYMLKISDLANSADKYQFVEFMRDKMTRYRSMTSSFIFDYFVYFSRSDTIVKADVLTDSRSFYSTYYTFKGQSYEQWRKGLLTSPHKVSYLPVASLSRGLNPLASIENIPKEVIVYAQTLPVNSQSENLGNFFVLIDVDQIKKMFAQLEAASHSNIYIIDNDGQTIMSTSTTPFPAELLQRMEHTDAPFAYRLAGVDQMVSFVSSQRAGFKYVSITPNDVFMQQVNQIQRWSLGLFVLCLIAGLLAVGAGVYRSYKPLQKTVNAIMRGKPMSGRPSFDEYEFIRQTIEGSMHEEKHLRNTLTRQTPFIRANYLSRLLHGYMDVNVSAENEESLRFMDLKFISDRFAVLLVKIEDMQHFSEEDEQQWALARFIVSNISVDLIEPRHKGFPVELDRDRLALLVNLATEREEKAEADIRDIVQSLYEIISQRFKIGITVAAGRIHQGPKAIRDSYPEALAALEYRLILGKHAIIYFQDIVSTKQHYYYPLEIEVQLTNFVRSGDTDNVGKLLDKIYSMNFDSSHITPELGRCLFFNVMSTFLKILNSTNTNQEDVLGTDFDPIKAVFSHPTAEDMQRKTKELYETLTRSFNVERSDHSMQLLQEMVAFVDCSLGDPNLGLALIADRFRMTPQYISTFFKKNQGQNLLDYITQKRMQTAKRLMDNRELTIAQIAQMVGYNNDVVFIRAFKKLEGITPGKFRDSIAPDKTGSDA
ncbi:AraC family transcriptional regulator [Gordoniibacillus kamchatkensis]|uniref:AraC family transcriptional regulator n=1 Tax=Gordoniibacillus kamchatkensis TaxID=1590651 RepID=A0ABR5ANP5_9BACL|nr:helix-turn-helix domain-containing protein [Paenibacillus sp. VKM B-2647]KIL42160.1 AraC family transcriptional regulator [Paenibacillus sp. VKM B-2647]